MARGSNQGEPTDWVTRAADDTVRHAGERGGDADRVITCASGASPSGPIHLGNLREFLTPHLVAEEIGRRGIAVRHLHSWDDYDRFRKVPAGVDPSWSEHIGRPLSAVPDPWACHESWAEHFKAPLREALAELGVEMLEISQTEQYRAGAYTEQVLHAIRHRDVIEDVLAKHRTKKADPEPENAQEAEALADSVADADEAAGSGDLARFPYKPYCRECGRDTVEVTAWDDETTDLSYTCSSCGFTGVTNVATQHEGKLVWKVDWPMRWAYEGVDFEPGGLDHSTPGSSYTVGKELVKRVFDFRAPSYVAYAFVGFAGMQKMSSSSGGVPTASDALQILEAPILRWLYARRQPKQAFDIDFGAEVVRLYDEWDALGRKAANPDKRDATVLAFERASSTAAAGVLPTPRVVVPFRLLSSVADVTAGNLDQVSRIVGEVGHPHDSIRDLEPRLVKAATWATEFVPESERTTVRTSPDLERLAALDEDEERWLAQLLDRLPDTPSPDELTALIYGVPKLARGLGLDDAPTDQVKADQKAFFKLLYNLLVDADRGPRLPTLFLALGSERVRSLLRAPQL
ncbi:lysine--tRNA ligase [Nocardioides lianchengensis]|uniref:Lysine--tRNA ligase n=1 Tax=Nocardioides lianchengensis TaxID=1045774 RepID=A0A1G6XZF3_9ACTN|nr:lysine--tRNA ligase [Nocardioides lianchengensis]NYG13499.1 lysyl-tRNA synthetase class 1 [Nocardioides lianchengensis]SDD83548.1 lysyl-tRNA synthetase, class I [Nocardioides lianchengensis]